MDQQLVNYPRIKDKIFKSGGRRDARVVIETNASQKLAKKSKLSTSASSLTSFKEWLTRDDKNAQIPSLFDAAPQWTRKRRVANIPLTANNLVMASEHVVLETRREEAAATNMQIDQLFEEDSSMAGTESDLTSQSGVSSLSTGSAGRPKVGMKQPIMRNETFMTRPQYGMKTVPQASLDVISESEEEEEEDEDVMLEDEEEEEEEIQKEERMREDEYMGEPPQEEKPTVEDDFKNIFEEAEENIEVKIKESSESSDSGTDNDDEHVKQFDFTEE